MSGGNHQSQRHSHTWPSTTQDCTRLAVLFLNVGAGGQARKFLRGTQYKVYVGMFCESRMVRVENWKLEHFVSSTY